MSLVSSSLVPATEKPAAVKVGEASARKPSEPTKKADNLSFWDFLDIVNPLQHIPLVGSVYREITGDKINGLGRIAGGALFGGVLGAVLGGVNTVMVQQTGLDAGQTLMAITGVSDDSISDKPVGSRAASHDVVPVIDVAPSYTQHKAHEAADRLKTVEPAAGHPPASLPHLVSQLEKTAGMPQKAALTSLPEVDAFSAQQMATISPGADFSRTMLDALAKYDAMQNMTAKK